MLNKPVEVVTKSGEKCSVFFMDCEGLGAYDMNSEHDTRLFSMAVLLCSCLVFNSHGTLDENTLAQLGLIANLTQYTSTSAVLRSFTKSPPPYSFLHGTDSSAIHSTSGFSLYSSSENGQS